MKSTSLWSSKMHLLVENDEKNAYMHEIPPKNGRYIVLDTETSGMSRADHVVELAAIEVVNGAITGKQFHVYIKPRIIMSQSVIKIHNITNDFYQNNFSDVYLSDKNNLENFLSFIGSSLIFAHNAPFDMYSINSELKYWKLPTIESKRYRCTMRIMYDITSSINPNINYYMNLGKCCEYFKLNADGQFHTAIYDALMTAKVLCKIYQFLDGNKSLRENKKVNYSKCSIVGFLTEKSENSNNKIEEAKKGKRKQGDLMKMFGDIQKEKKENKEDPVKVFEKLFNRKIAKRPKVSVSSRSENKGVVNKDNKGKLNKIESKEEIENKGTKKNNGLVESDTKTAPAEEDLILSEEELMKMLG